MKTIRLRIGNYTFKLSPRDEMDFDFGRSIAKLETIGGPTYQDVGVNEKKLTFSGAFVGDDAWQQAEQLEQIMDTGKPVALVYGPIHRTVRIENFNPKVKRLDYVLYDFDMVIIPSNAGFSLPSSSGSASSTTTTTNAPPATSTSSIKQHADKTVTVMLGQTLWAIAQNEYKNVASNPGQLWPVIAKINGIQNERSVKAGQKLIIPSAANVQKALDAYNNRINAVIAPAGIAYLQSLEAKSS